jgi:hypothetical protein
MSRLSRLAAFHTATAATAALSGRGHAGPEHSGHDDSPEQGHPDGPSEPHASQPGLTAVRTRGPPPFTTSDAHSSYRFA